MKEYRTVEDLLKNIKPEVLKAVLKKLPPHELQAFLEAAKREIKPTEEWPDGEGPLITKGPHFFDNSKGKDESEEASNKVENTEAPGVDFMKPGSLKGKF